MPSTRNLLRLVVIVILIATWIAAVAMPVQTERRVTRVAEGVYAIEHKNALDGFISGNTTVIVGERQVFVVDAGFLPSVAREDIAQIRQWTDKPVSFLFNTHFHNDHNLANRIYMDAFPALTIIAHVETKKSMDMFGPGSESREEKTDRRLQTMLDSGKTGDGTPLTEDDKKEVKDALAKRTAGMAEIRNLKFQSATLTFEQGFTVDIGNREVQVKFLGRGNTAGDAIVYLPREKIVMTGDLVVYPLPMAMDGYPSDWIQTLQNLAQLDAQTFVPGHGPVLHDNAYIFQIRDLLKSAVDQWNAKLAQAGPGMFRTLDEAKTAVDLTPFKKRFVGDDEELGAQWDNLAANLTKIVFVEASLRQRVTSLSGAIVDA